MPPTPGQLISAQWKTLPIAPKDCTGQTYIVTGANTGLGLETARHYVRLNASRVIVASRSLSKGDAAKKSIDKSTGRPGVAEVWQLDLGSHDSIKAFAKKAQSLERIDALVENAGVAMTSRWEEVAGTEIGVQTNVVGTFLLAMLLMPKIRETQRKFKITPRITVVTSGVALRAKFNEGKEDDIYEALSNRSKSEQYISERYPVSKLMQMMIVRQMAARISSSQVIINSISPGLCVTELNRNASWGKWLEIIIMRFLLGRTAEQGSRTLLHAANSGEESHGKLVSDCELKEYWCDGVPNLENKQLQERVYDQLCAILEKIEPGCVTAAMNGK